MKEAIRLTNKTAAALRKSAQQVRTAYFAAGVLMSLLLIALGVYWGFQWLPAVPLSVAAAVLLDWALIIRSRSRYMSLLGQAICTEAAAREIRAGRSESLRREQAIRDLMRAKADVMTPSAAKPAGGEQPAARSDAEDAQKAAAGQPEQSGAHSRRRRQAGLQLIRSEQAAK